MSDIAEIGGQKYRIGRIDARKQFHVARRLAPLLAGLGSLSGKGEGFATAVAPLAEALSSMPDSDVDYVLDVCLGACQRVQPNGHAAPIMARGELMFEDIDMAQMVQIAIRVIQQNLGSFFPGAAAA